MATSTAPHHAGRTAAPSYRSTLLGRHIGPSHGTPEVTAAAVAHAVAAGWPHADMFARAVDVNLDPHGSLHAHGCEFGVGETMQVPGWEAALRCDHRFLRVDRPEACEAIPSPRLVRLLVAAHTIANVGNRLHHRSVAGNVLNVVLEVIAFLRRPDEDAVVLLDRDLTGFVGNQETADMLNLVLSELQTACRRPIQPEVAGPDRAVFHYISNTRSMSAGLLYGSGDLKLAFVPLSRPAKGRPVGDTWALYGRIDAATAALFDPAGTRRDLVEVNDDFTEEMLDIAVQHYTTNRSSWADTVTAIAALI